MRLYDDFIGGEYKSVTHSFTGGDSEQQFLENKSTQKDDWYYHHTPIEYSFNKLGHRSKNIEEIDLDNYILFTGCSHTAGVGVELEKTYAHLLSKQLNVDYYNIAMPATGIDVLEYNLLTWFAKIKKKPKMVIIQLPDHSRYAKFGIDKHHLLEGGSWSKRSNERSFIINSEDSGFFYARKLLSNNLLETLLTCPIYKFNITGQVSYSNNEATVGTRDLARDLAHPGILSNQHYVSVLYKLISESSVS